MRLFIFVVILTILTIYACKSSRADHDDLGPLMTGGARLDLTITSDYLNRGISQSFGRPVPQATLDYKFPSGFYLQGFASEVWGNGARAELDYGAGYRGTIGEKWRYDVGGLMTTYPDSHPSAHLNYFEGHGIVNRDLGWGMWAGSLYVSPDYQGRSGPEVYANTGLDYKLNGDWTVGGRVGYTTISDGAKLRQADYSNWSVNLTRTLPWDMDATATYSGTSTRQCSASCGHRFVLGMTKHF